MSDIDLDAYFDKLTNLALKDGILREEEKKLINELLNNLTRYNEILDEALEDGIIDNQEKAKLYNLRVKIIKESYRNAMEDSKIDKDELVILTSIQRIINELRNKEENFRKDI